MRKQMTALIAPRSVFSGSKNNVSARCKGLGLVTAGQRGGLMIGVDAHSRKIMPKPGFKEIALRW
jgi:hypothetical protein